MPFCSWCREFIEKSKPRWRCEICGTIFCEDCSRDKLQGNCPFCVRERGEEKTLFRQVIS